MLKLSDREFKITLNNILRTIMEKTDKNTRDWQYNQRYGNLKKVLKRDQK